MPSVIRLMYLCAYGVLAAIGEALVARPALLWVRSQGLIGPALAWDVPLGSLLLGCAALVAVFTLWLASEVAQRRRPPLLLHGAFLTAVGICFVVRSTSGNPRAPPDPAPSLLAGLRAAADELDRSYGGRYEPDAAQFASALARVQPPGFRRLGRTLALHARILSGADAAQSEPLEGDLPGTIYVAVSRDRQTAWLTAVGANGMLTLPSGTPALIEARAGTHALPGHDPLVPAYPRARPPGN
jgi:hypothetical protein